MLRSLRRWIPTAALVAGIAYFAGHAVSGPNGLLAWAEDRARLAALEVELAEAQATRHSLEARAARLREGGLDLDYLDERARALVGVGRRGDVVVPGEVARLLRRSSR